MTPNKVTSANQHFLYVLVNIFTFNELGNVTFSSQNMACL